MQGCDGSVLIQTPNGDAEKDSADNLSLAGDGFDTVIKAKQAVEAACPGIVSCADILALAAKDVVVLVRMPHLRRPPVFFFFFFISLLKEKTKTDNKRTKKQMIFYFNFKINNNNNDN